MLCCLHFQIIDRREIIEKVGGSVVSAEVRHFSYCLKSELRSEEITNKYSFEGVHHVVCVSISRLVGPSNTTIKALY
jgi:hypothetical protein